MNKNVYELTAKGKEELEKEYRHLIDVERPANIEAIKDARAQGDLSENADYDAAREEQAKIEARIKEIENILKYAKIIRNDKTDAVTTGKTVTIEFVGTGVKKTYKLVGTIEADPLAGKISNDSPVGKAIINLREEEEASFKSETGRDVTVKVLKIE